MSDVDALVRLNRLGRPFFSTGEAADVLGSALSQTSRLLARLSDAGAIAKVTHGVWSISPGPDALLFASWAGGPWPTYLSFASALRYHGMITQIPRAFTVASAGKPRSIMTTMGEYQLHQIGALVFGGYEETAHGRIATPEKALFDVAYLRRVGRGAFSALPEVELPEGFADERAYEWLERVGDKSLRTAVAATLKGLLAEARTGA
jgi:predicted transcriptional regulator of viral defense system